MILITNIAEAIISKKTDEELLPIIQEFIGEGNSVAEWRLANYSELRRWAYPEYSIYLDAQVKMNSTEESIQKEGQDQLQTYYQNCIAVKQRFPKS